MRQKTDFTFQALLKRAKGRKFNIKDVYILNKRVATKLPIFGLLATIVVVQKNKTRYLINQLQIKRFTRANN